MRGSTHAGRTARQRAFHVLVAALAAVLASPALAWACPVCFSAKNEATRIAFLATTVFLTALPLVLIGGVGVWLAKRIEDAERDHADPAGTAVPPVQPVLTAHSLPPGAD